jgi:hypothetical protein
MSKLTRKLISMAGYSQTPLIKKLGIIPSTRVLLINPPSNYMELLGDQEITVIKKGKVPDLVHLFAENLGQFEKEMQEIKQMVKENPAITIWVSWYKKAAKIPTDITEDLIRSYALINDLVDVKVCAVDEKWSGLKLVVPLKKRKV